MELVATKTIRMTCVSVQGGDHTSTVSDGYDDMGGAVFQDSAVVCMFCVDGDLTWDFTRAVTRRDITKDKWCSEQGSRIVTLQRVFLLFGGPDIFWNPDDDVVWSETNTTSTYFDSKTVKSGLYKVEVQNPNQQTIGWYIQVTVSTEVKYRPLEPLGSWLTLISLPIFGLGLWTSGIPAVIQEMGKKAS